MPIDLITNEDLRLSKMVIARTEVESGIPEYAATDNLARAIKAANLELRPLTTAGDKKIVAAGLRLLRIATYWVALRRDGTASPFTYPDILEILKQYGLEAVPPSVVDSLLTRLSDYGEAGDEQKEAPTAEPQEPRKPNVSDYVPLYVGRKFIDRPRGREGVVKSQETSRAGGEVLTRITVEFCRTSPLRMLSLKDCEIGDDFVALPDAQYRLPPVTMSELSAAVGGLRMLANRLAKKGLDSLPPHFRNILDSGGTCRPLSAEEADDLAERFNCDSEDVEEPRKAAEVEAEAPEAKEGSPIYGLRWRHLENTWSARSVAAPGDLYQIVEDDSVPLFEVRKWAGDAPAPGNFGSMAAAYKWCGDNEAKLAGKAKTESVDDLFTAAGGLSVQPLRFDEFAGPAATTWVAKSAARPGQAYEVRCEVRCDGDRFRVSQWAGGGERPDYFGTRAEAFGWCDLNERFCAEENLVRKNAKADRGPPLRDFDARK